MWLTVDEFKKRSNISIFTNPEIEEYLRLGKEIVQQYVLPMQTRKALNHDNKVILDLHELHLSDYYSYDGEINKSNNWEVHAYERDKDTDEIYELNNHITSIVTKFGRVNFDIDVPTSNSRKLYVDYWLGIEEWDKIYPQIKNLQYMCTIRDILNNKAIGAGVVMASSWSLNGQSQDSTTGLDALLTNLNTNINRLIKQLQPLIISSRDISHLDNPYLYRRF